MSPSKTTSLDPKGGHRIGAVSALSGIPVPTLRVWEIRYGTFSPRLTSGGQRLYSDDDVLRATLLKRLTEQGHSISSIANHDTNRLNALLQQQNTSQRRETARNAETQTVTAVVVGLALAARLASEKFKSIFAANSLQVTDIFPDLETAQAALLPGQPQFLLLSVNSLHILAQVDLRRLIDRCKLPQTIVLYRFGQEQVIESMKRSGVVVRR